MQQTYTTPRIYAPVKPTESRRTLPQSWSKAAGLLKHRQKALERHTKKIRREWSARSVSRP